MSSGRKFSVRRHIDNYNIHSGQGKVIPFIEYAIGRREGKYLIQEFRNSGSQSFSVDRIYDKITEKLENEIAEQIAKAICHDMLADQNLFNNLKMMAKSKIVRKNYYKYFKELMS